MFQDSFPLRMPVFNSQFVTTVICALGFGSLISLLAFTVLGLVFRHELDQRHEEGRRFVTRLLESRLGQSHVPLPNGQLKELEVIVPPGLLVAPVPAIPGTAERPV